MSAAKFVGLPLDMFAAHWREPVNAGTQALLQPLIQDAALTQSINEAWAMVALLTVAALVCVPFARWRAK
jgi:DHA2 family multidrug resistance protein